MIHKRLLTHYIFKTSPSISILGLKLQINQFSVTFQDKQQIKLNSYLRQRLKYRNLLNLKDFQLQTFKKVALENKNCFINSCTGSGKTLAYLLPTLNQILNQKQQIFANVNQNQENAEYESNFRHGALIFTLNKQLVLQIYREIRLIDTQNRLNVYRIGPISHFAPEKTPEDQDEIDDTVNRNIIKCVNWRKTDIIISTPQMFWNIMTSFNHNKNNLINPKFMVIDEADLLLELDQNVSKYTHNIISLIKGEKLKKSKDNNIKKFITFEDESNGDSKTKFLMSSSSFPKKINKQSYSQYLQKQFNPISTITGINKHRLPQRLELNYIDIQSKNSDIPNQQSQEVLNEKLFYLSKIITDPKKISNRFIIFCHNKKHVEKVSEFLTIKLKKSVIQYYASLPSDQRSLNLFKFSNQDFNILVSTDLGSRGLDFSQPIHTVIEFDLSENIVNFINRAGRTGRNELPGQIISFVEDKNKQFFENLSTLSSLEEEFDQLFSRKRSYNKIFLPRQSQESQ